MHGVADSCQVAEEVSWSTHTCKHMCSRKARSVLKLEQGIPPRVVRHVEPGFEAERIERCPVQFWGNRHAHAVIHAVKKQRLSRQAVRETWIAHDGPVVGAEVVD